MEREDVETPVRIVRFDPVDYLTMALFLTVQVLNVIFGIHMWGVLRPKYPENFIFIPAMLFWCGFIFTVTGLAVFFIGWLINIIRNKNGATTKAIQLWKSLLTRKK